MKSLPVLASLGAAVTLAAAAPAVAASAATHHTPTVVGHVYVNDNTPGANTIGSFVRHANGSLTPAKGSPFKACGAGTGSGTASQGALEQSPNGKYLLAVDAGSNQISVLRIKPNGSLAKVSVAASHGTAPVSISATTWVNGQALVYVANAGDPTASYEGGNYTGFILSRSGVLRHLGESTVSVPTGSQLGDVLFNATGTSLAGTRVGSGLVDSFNVGRNGLIYPAAASPYPSQGPGPIGAEFRPTNAKQLFVSNAHGGPNNGTVSAFKVSRGGSLTSIGSGPFADNQTAPCWVEITHNGKYLFTTNTAVPSISAYRISADGSLTLLGTTPLSGTTEKGPIDLRLSPNGKQLYVVDGGSAAISSFNVKGGALSAIGTTPVTVPHATAPVGIVVD
jgi:hypothetical protein